MPVTYSSTDLRRIAKAKLRQSEVVTGELHYSLVRQAKELEAEADKMEAYSGKSN
jgi:hypothetical protein